MNPNGRSEFNSNRLVSRRAILASVATSAVLSGCTRAPAEEKSRHDQTSDVHSTHQLLKALENGQQMINLAPGEFDLTETLVLRPGTTLSGAGQLSRLRPARSFPEDRPLVAIGNNEGPAEAVMVKDLVLDCDTRARNGLAIEGTARHGYQNELDSMCRLDNLWVYDSAGDGILYGGTDSRSIISTRLRVRRARGHGMHIANTDSWWDACEATTFATTGETAGFMIAGANNFFEACKAWYCRDYGWRIRGIRNKFTGCEAQDTRLHGWNIEWDKNVFAACVADTAGMYDVGGVPDTADGFYVAGGNATSLVGCQAFDRRPERTVPQQRYGFNVPAAFIDAGNLVAATGYDNTSGLIHAR